MNPQTLPEITPVSPLPLVSAEAAPTESDLEEASETTAIGGSKPKQVRKPRSDKGKPRVKTSGPVPTSGKPRAKKSGTKPTSQKPSGKKRAKKAVNPDEIPLKRIGNTKHDVRHYVRTKSASGSSSMDSGDQVAQELRGMELDEVYSKVAKVLGETITSLKAKYAKLNVGMQRMNLGNRYRAAIDTSEEE